MLTYQGEQKGMHTGDLMQAALPSICSLTHVAVASRRQCRTGQDRTGLPGLPL